MSVFVLDRNQRPLMPCSEKRARKLLATGRARVHRLIPFCIRIVDRRLVDSALQPIRLKLDPGSKVTGLALVCERAAINTVTGEVIVTANVLNLFELVHRGRQISVTLTSRRQMRRRRRSKVRNREPRFLNRGNAARGRLAPSLQHRIDTTLSWVTRFQRWVPVTAISQELVRFDMRRMENPKIPGDVYQHGTFVGYEMREYLLAKWERNCAYCDVRGVALHVDRVLAKSRGGSDRLTNLTLACVSCISKRATRDVNEFLKRDPFRLARIRAQLKHPLLDTAAVNTTRQALCESLKATGLPVSTGSSGLTEYNRNRLAIPKTHALDAACVDGMAKVVGWRMPTLSIKCTGRGSYQRTRLDGFGFPRGYLMRQKSVHGFRTGDIVTARVTKGVNIGTYTGRVAVRKTGSFNIQTQQGVVQGISYKHCKVIQRADGYGYSQVAKMDVTCTPPK